jgi:hypothetical protein
VRRQRVIDGSEPASATGWKTPELAALLLFRVRPSDRALAGWDPGWWHLPDTPGNHESAGAPR